MPSLRHFPAHRASSAKFGRTCQSCQLQPTALDHLTTNMHGHSALPSPKIPTAIHNCSTLICTPPRSALLNLINTIHHHCNVVLSEFTLQQLYCTASSFITLDSNSHNSSSKYISTKEQSNHIIQDEILHLSITLFAHRRQHCLIGLLHSTTRIGRG